MKKLFIFIFILFSFVTQNLHAKDFFYEIYGLNLKFMEIQFSNSPHQELATKIKSKGLLNFFVSFKGNGSTKAHAKQTSYQFQYQKKKKARATTIVFKDRKVIKNISQPARKKQTNIIPIQSHHLQNIVDPLTAINQLLFNQKSKLNCNQRTKVFDGSDVFYLILSKQSNKDHIVNSSKITFKKPLRKCRLQYQTIAGHKAKDEKKFNKSYVDIFYGKQDAVYLPYFLRTKSKISLKMFLK